MKIPKGFCGEMLKRKVKVYDAEAKVLLEEFDSIMACATALKMPKSTIIGCIKRKGKCAPKTNVLNKYLAFR